MQAAKHVKFKLAPKLSNEVQCGHTYNYLKIRTLVSVVQLADDDCDTIFSKHELKVSSNGNLIIKGYRNQSNSLWNIPLSMTDKPTVPEIKLHALGVI